MKLKLFLISAILLSLACSLPLPFLQPAQSDQSELSGEEARQANPDLEVPAATPAGVPVPEPQIIKIQMLDEQNGWALTEINLLRTVDGGVNWYAIALPGNPILGYSAKFDFSPSGSGWVLTTDDPSRPDSAGIFLRTMDNGVSWTFNPVPFMRGSIQFVDPQNGWAMADMGVGAGSNAVAIYQTTDGGQTWDQVYTNDPTRENASDTLPLSGLKSGLAALNMQTAWVSGTTYAPDQIYFFRTDDGGITWSPQEVQMPLGTDDQTLYAVESSPIFVNDQQGYLPVRVYGEPSKLNIYSTQDGGLTWTPCLSPLSNGMRSDFISPTEVMVWDGERFNLSTDRGESWIGLTPNVGFSDTFVLMDFVSRTTGWVITGDTLGNRSLYKTSDGGNTWELLIP